MTVLTKIFQLLCCEIKALQQKITLRLLLPFFSGAFVLVFFTFTLLHSDPEIPANYNDELGFTGDNDYVSIEKSPQAKKSLLIVTRGQIKAGESLSSLLAEKGFTPKEIRNIKKELKGKFSPRSFQAGQSYETTKNSDGSLQSFSYILNQTTTIHIEKLGKTGRFTVKREITAYDTRIASLEGTVTQSLSNSLKASGRPALMTSVAALFSSRINFRNDITRGAKYKILFEEKWLMNEFIGTGKILAVELSLPNQSCRAYLYTDGNGKSGYFDEHGRAVDHITLFASPCSFAHISSGFGYRIHPLTGRKHFHGGVDMAATAGTPVRAAADGKLIFRGKKGMAGAMVTLEHSGHYYSQYLHLSRFAPGIGYSRRIRQGEIIGYVGSTGRSTGPHLDFRIIHNGKPVNPLVALHSANFGTISPAKMSNFLASISVMKAQFDNGRILVASSPLAPPASRRTLVTI